jgi:hypothetical protein
MDITSLPLNEWGKPWSNSTGNCVEIMITNTGVLVRNSRYPEIVLPEYTFEEWAAFIKGVKVGMADLVPSVQENPEAAWLKIQPEVLPRDWV